MFVIDEMAYKSRFRKWPPLGKLLMVLALLIGSLLAPSPLVPLIVFVIGLTLLYASCKFSLPKLMAFACLNTFIMLVISVMVIGLFTPGQALASGVVAGWQLTVTRQGANLAILVFIRALAGFSLLLFFASSTPIPHLFFAMRQVGLPAFLAELTVLVYRYSFMLLEQMGQMITAADCRLGFRTMRQSISTTGKLTASLFGRSMDFAERAQAALLCRNFRGEFMPFRQPAKLNAGWVAGPLILLAALVVIGQQYPNILVI